MALGTAIETSQTSPAKGFDVVAPASHTSRWETLITAGGVTVADSAAALLNPDDATSLSSRTPIWRRGKGTNLILRVRYSSASTVTTQLIVTIFGQSGTDEWDCLPSKGGNLIETITCTPATDKRGASFSVSPINFTTLSWDCLGCEKFVALVSTAMAGSALTTATLQGKII